MLYRSQSAPVQTLDEWPLSLRYNDHRQSQKSSTCSSLDDEEVTSLAYTEYEEWPMQGFFKRTVIGNKTSYSLDFSLEQLQELCASLLPLPTVGHGSKRYHFAKHNSPPNVSPPSTSIQAKRLRSALSFQRNNL
jgi:hypothetical protein